MSLFTTVTDHSYIMNCQKLSNCMCAWKIPRPFANMVTIILNNFAVCEFKVSEAQTINSCLLNAFPRKINQL